MKMATIICDMNLTAVNIGSLMMDSTVRWKRRFKWLKKGRCFRSFSLLWREWILSETEEEDESDVIEDAEDEVVVETVEGEVDPLFFFN
jgi:hypothetical protein